MTTILTMIILGIVSLLILYSVTAHIRKLSQQLITSQQNHQTELLKQQQHHQAQQSEDKLNLMQLIPKTIGEHMSLQMNEVRAQLQQNLQQQTLQTNQQLKTLTETTKSQLQSISQQVEQRLAKGFEKTTDTFNDIAKRLALIDRAQQQITELSTNVVSLQEILADKRSRGAFGEVQLASLVRNMIPESHFSLQHSLSNNTRVDCLLFLPPPTGNIAIDAKFPLESYQTMQQLETNDANYKKSQQQFRVDIKKHINDISSKYIIAGETADGAMMFIPAEAIFAELHAHFPDLVTYAQNKHVWIGSPTTMMAILTTAKAVIKDDATRQQVHVIQSHLGKLAEDFSRFQQRMDKLSTHIDQAHRDVTDVHTSAKKISTRFEKIEQVQLEDIT